MDIQEHNTTAKLPALLDEMSAHPEAEWGIARICRRYLKPMTSEALLMAIKPSLTESRNPHVFLDEEEQILITWEGSPKKVFKQLHGIILSGLTQCDPAIKSSSIVGYIDASTHLQKLKDVLRVMAQRGGRDHKERTKLFEDLLVTGDIFDFEENEANLLGDTSSFLTATTEQISHYQQQKSNKPYRKQLQILVAEDLVFSQKLISDIIRGVRNQAGLSPLTDIVASVQEAWGIFLKKAPDICFVDLHLVGGSGHTLVRAIKEIDPSTNVIVVTANNFEEELAVARQNNVDGFITKPYTKKQILDCIEKYKSTLKSVSKSATRF